MISHFFDKHGRLCEEYREEEEDEGARSLASFHLMHSWTSSVFGKYYLMQCFCVLLTVRCNLAGSTCWKPTER